MAAILKSLQITFVNFSALALKVRTQISADVRTFIPIDSEPFQTLINRGRSFLGVAFDVSVLDSQHKFSAVMAHKEPVEQSRARAADVEITSRGRSKANTNIGTHFET